MPDFIKRIRSERVDLLTKISGLARFLDTKADTLDSNQFDLMVQQLAHMKEYAEVLSQRLELLDAK